MKNPFRKLLALAFNSASHRCLAVGLATNVSILGTEEWQPLAQYGETEYWHEETPGNWKKYRQIVTRAQADAMVLAINALKTRQGQAFRGLPIYRGHPDADPKQWPDDARYGAIMDLEARETEIFSKLAWNDLGKANKENGYYIYPSPAWLYDQERARRDGIIAPDELQSVGLTNRPRIGSSVPWTNSEPAGHPPDSPVEKQTNENNKNLTDMDFKKMLLKTLGLAEDATDEAITGACEKKAAFNTAPLAVAIGTETFNVIPAADADKEIVARVTGLATNATTAQAAASKFRALAVNAALDRGINEGRITAAERPGFETKFATDFDTAQTELNGKQVALNTQALNLKPAAEGTDLSTPTGRRLAFNAEVDKHQRAGIGNMNDIVTAMQATVEGRAILTAMEEKKAS